VFCILPFYSISFLSIIRLSSQKSREISEIWGLATDFTDYADFSGLREHRDIVKHKSSTTNFYWSIRRLFKLLRGLDLSGEQSFWADDQSRLCFSLFSKTTWLYDAFHLVLKSKARANSKVLQDRTPRSRHTSGK